MSSSKNTGKPSERIFDQHFALLGKRAYVHAFTDASEATGMNQGRVGKGGFVNIKAQPADRLVVLDGVMFLAEVKSSTATHDRFDFKLLKPGQKSAASQTVSAGGGYWVYYHHLSTDEWFRFPYALVQQAQTDGASSLALDFLRRANSQWVP